MESSPIAALVAALTGTPLAPLAVYVPLIIAVSAVLAAILPVPPPGSPWLPLRRLLDLLAFNVGTARNLPGPTSKQGDAP
jgi:hypothetical protein